MLTHYEIIGQGVQTLDTDRHWSSQHYLCWLCPQFFRVHFRPISTKIQEPIFYLFHRLPLATECTHCGNIATAFIADCDISDCRWFHCGNIFIWMCKLWNCFNWMFLLWTLLHLNVHTVEMLYSSSVCIRSQRGGEITTGPSKSSSNHWIIQSSSNVLSLSPSLFYSFS